MNLIEVIASEYKIPYISEDHKVWFFRTKAGRYYRDFKLNNYIALGWDKLPASLITSVSTQDFKKSEIELAYPDEKRPGLILSQMDIFYNGMRPGDHIVIPSEGSKEITIGTLGDIQDDISHKKDSEKYEKCDFIHRRSVNWLKSVEMTRDIYLLKELRAQQTISDLTKNSDLIFRNLFSFYVSDDGIHITMQKVSPGDFQLSQSLKLESSFMDFFNEVAELYGMKNFTNEIHKKTAVGSPGFLELILPYAPISVISIIILFVGFEKNENGFSAGVLGVISKINDLINDHRNREKTAAETELLKAQTKKTIAETELISVQTESLKKANYQGKQIEFVRDGKTNIELEIENEKLILPDLNNSRLTIDDIASKSGEIKSITEECGIELGKTS